MLVLLQEDVLDCSGSVLFPCVANGVTSIFFQVYKPSGNRFLTLTSTRIREDPDYDEMWVNGTYSLRVNHVEKYNGSLFRCAGVLNGERVLSNVVPVLAEGELVWCRRLCMF